MRIIGVIQARMGSQRLPGKMLMNFNGKPLIEWVIKRTIMSKKLSDVIVAIPDDGQNDVLEEKLNELNVKCHRGSMNDVLGRIVEASKAESADYVVRICGDNPFVSGNEIDNLIDFHIGSDYDYSYNHIPKNNLYPDGLGAEICSFKLLNEINLKELNEEQREHCFNYIWDNENVYKIKTFDPEKEELRRPEIKLDVDTKEDFVKLSELNINIYEKDEKILKIYKEGKTK